VYNIDYYSKLLKLFCNASLVSTGLGAMTVSGNMPSGTPSALKSIYVLSHTSGGDSQAEYVYEWVTSPPTPTPTPTGVSTLLWAETTGRASIWTLDVYGNKTSEMLYGPYTGWTPRSYHRNSDGTANMLWGRIDGYVSLWMMDAGGNPTSMSYYGPYEGWTAKSYYRNSDGTANMLWAENTGRASIWMMDTSGNKTSEMLYGPYEGWTAQDYD